MTGTEKRDGRLAMSLNVLKVMPAEEHQVDENEEVIYVNGFAGVFAFSLSTSVRVETAIEIMFSDVGA